jgi:adenylate cyclase
MAEATASDSTGRLPDRRKLVAVVYADMVGYSRLIGLDDAGTLRRLRALRHDLINPAIDEYGGKIVQTGGDSLLIVFDSIDGAMRCAVKVQQQVSVFDADHPPDRAIRFRIGISIGDAIADGTDLHGDAVNVAARLQAEYPPGGICVTRPIRDHVQDRLNLAFEELGALTLKNIARPVEAFLADSSGQEFRKRFRPYTSEHLLSDRPSIAVLPFANLSSDPEQEYFSDGVADDIITELSRSRWLFVIARNSSFTYRSRSIDVKQIASELGVRYLLDGSVRRSGDRVRVTAQLIEADSLSHLWVERYDRKVDEVFAVQDEITASITTAILPAVASAEQRRVIRKPPSSISAWEIYQRGVWHLSKFTRADNEQARSLFIKATEIDPGFGMAYVRLAKTYTNDALHGIRPLAEAVKLAEVEARKAVEIDPHDPEARNILGQAFFLNGDSEAALDCVERAMALNRNSAVAHTLKGGILIYSKGRYAEGRSEMSTALCLDPRDPSSHHAATLIAASYYYERDYAAAVEAARRSLADYPTFPAPCRFLIAALAQLGRIDEAASALRNWTVAAPIVFESFVKVCPVYMRRDDHKHLLEGLRRLASSEVVEIRSDARCGVAV